MINKFIVIKEMGYNRGCRGIGQFTEEHYIDIMWDNKNKSLRYSLDYFNEAVTKGTLSVGSDYYDEQISSRKRIDFQG